MPRFEIRSIREIQDLRRYVRSAAQYTREKMNAVDANPMAAFHELKFNEFGCHPTDKPQRCLNFVEQLNQTFTIMASLAAADHLLKCFPGSVLRLNSGATQGWDIESIGTDVVCAEVFTAVRPENNGKLRKDIERLAKSNANNRYVFFYAPSHSPGRRTELEPAGSDIQVWALRREEIM